MRLFVMMGLCAAFGFAMGAWFQFTQSKEETEAAAAAASKAGQPGMGTDMSLFLSTSGILCEALGNRPRSEEIQRIGNQARQRREAHDNRLLTELLSEPSQTEAISEIIAGMNDGLRSRVNGMVLRRGDGEKITRLEAIDFVVGNLSLVKSAEESLRSQLNDEQIERLGDETLNPFAYLDEDVVLLFHSLTTSSMMP
jgi:hypothetical protein